MLRPMATRHWLLKSEPESFSIDDLARAPKQTTFWNGVRNYQARNLLRDEMKVGDGVIFYHSNADPAAAVGLATAVRVTKSELAEVNERVLDLQEKLVAAVTLIPGCEVTGLGALRVPGTVHLTFEDLASDELLFLLDQEGVCASAAASCSSGAASPSHVLAAMGVSRERARGSLRLSMGAETTDHEVDAVIAILSRVVYQLRSEA